MKPDYYQLLDLRPDATSAEIKKNFRKLAKQFHPDRNPGNADAEERFKLINESYEQLGDPDKRADYDRYLSRLQPKKTARRSTAWYDDFHPVDEQLRDFLQGFYRGRSSSEQRAARGNDVRFNLKVAFYEAVLGCVKEIRLPISAECPRCGGSGIPAAARQQRCKQCHGTGRDAGYRKKCGQCRGTGKVYLDQCKRCSGNGKVASYRAIEVNVPPGIETGTRLHLKGLGTRGKASGRAGDFFVVVQVAKHPLLKIEDGMLVCRIPIPVYLALSGGEIEVPTLDGTVTVKVPQGSRSGQEIRVKGQGAYGPTGKRRTDLIVRLDVEMPKKTTRAEKKLIEQLAGMAAASSYPETKKFKRVLSGLGPGSATRSRKSD